MGDPAESLATVLAYHERTKHHPGRFARSLGHLDWATQPDPFRRFAGAPVLSLELVRFEDQPRYEPAFFLGNVPPVPLGRRWVSQLFQDSLALSAWKQAGAARWSLRVNPSSGNLHPTEGYLIAGPVEGLADKPAVYAYSDNDLIDLKHAVIMDVEATTAIRQAEVGAAKTMLDRTAEQFDVSPSRLVADAGYGSAEMIGWLVDERGIEPHVKLMDKSERTDGALSRSDFAFDPEGNLYVCPGGKELRKYHRSFSKPRDGVTKEGTMIYFARKHDCEACALKPKCCPNAPARKIARSIHEAARDKARAIAKTEAYAVSRRERKKVEMLFAHLKRILRLDRLRLRGPSGAKDEFLLAATAQNLRKLAKLIPLPTPVFAA